MARSAVIEGEAEVMEHSDVIDARETS